MPINPPFRFDPLQMPVNINWGGKLFPGVFVAYTLGYSGEGTFLGVINEKAPPSSGGSSTASWSTQIIAPGLTYGSIVVPYDPTGQYADGLSFTDPDNFFVTMANAATSAFLSNLFFSIDASNTIHSGASSFSHAETRGDLIWTDPGDGGSIFVNSFQVVKLFGASVTPVWEVDSALDGFTGYVVDTHTMTVTMTDMQTSGTQFANAVKIDMTAGATISTTAILPSDWLWNSPSGISGSLDGGTYAINGIPDPSRFDDFPSSWSVTRFEQDGTQTWSTVVAMPPQYGVPDLFNATLAALTASQWSFAILVNGDTGLLDEDTDPYPHRRNVAVYALDQKTGTVTVSEVIGPIQSAAPSIQVPAEGRLSLFEWYPGVV